MFDDHGSLTSITLRTRQGEFIAIVSPSGCGKSTFMKLATGLKAPTRGSISIDGSPVTAQLKIVGMAFQAPTLLAWRTTLDNVLLPLEIVEPHRSRFRSNRAQHEAQALRLLKTVGLDGYAQQLPWQMSGGMQRRASICRADPRTRYAVAGRVFARSMRLPARNCGASCATCRRRSSSTSSWSPMTCAKRPSWQTPFT